MLEKNGTYQATAKHYKITDLKAYKRSEVLEVFTADGFSSTAAICPEHGSKMKVFQLKKDDGKSHLYYCEKCEALVIRKADINYFKERGLFAIMGTFDDLQIKRRLEKLEDEKQTIIEAKKKAMKKAEEIKELQWKKHLEEIAFLEQKKLDEHISSIRNIVQARNISGLIHFTRIDSAVAIVQDGIKSRYILDKEGKIETFNDKKRLDNHTKCTCFSVEFPNDYLFKRFRNDNGGKWVVMEISPKILYDVERRIYFCPDNAAASTVRHRLWYDQFMKPKDFDNMFADVYFDRHTNRNVPREDLPKCYPSNSQAEILISGSISARYITRLYFQCEDDIKLFHHKLKDNQDILSKYKYEVAPRYFGFRTETYR